MLERFENFTVLFVKINRCIHKIKSEEMAKYDLKTPHVSCLYYLYRAGTLTARELCDLCAEDKGAISRSIDYLETNGYVTCDSQTKKRYKAPLSLTDKGVEVSRKIAAKIDAFLQRVGDGLTEENRVNFYQSLVLIDRYLEKICSEYGEKNYGN